MIKTLFIASIACTLAAGGAVAQTKPKPAAKGTATKETPLPMEAAKPGAYPDKPVRFMVPFAPGGTTDLIARMVGQKMSESLGQPLVIDNRGGGGGTIATDIVAKAAGDGYTLMMNHQGMTFNATLYAKLPYDTLNDFATIAMVGVTPNVMVVNPNVAAKSVKELVALAKAKPKGVNYGSGGIGSSAHLAVELFQRLAGVTFQHVPYKGAGPALTDTIGGQIQMMIATMPAAAGHIRGNRLRAGRVGRKKIAGVPGVTDDRRSGRGRLRLHHVVRHTRSENAAEGHGAVSGRRHQQNAVAERFARQTVAAGHGSGIDGARQIRRCAEERCRTLG